MNGAGEWPSGRKTMKERDAEALRLASKGYSLAAIVRKTGLSGDRVSKIVPAALKRRRQNGRSIPPEMRAAILRDSEEVEGYWGPLAIKKYTFDDLAVKYGIARSIVKRVVQGVY